MHFILNQSSSLTDALRYASETHEEAKYPQTHKAIKINLLRILCRVTELNLES